jgi:2-polyprenyl-6-methoxyphenol hydroxylase-like FAD-dependent oxidoreductase
MAEVLVLGAGLNGLATAMLLAGDGHTVTVLERDAAEPAGGPTTCGRGCGGRGSPSSGCCTSCCPAGTP